MASPMMPAGGYAYDMESRASEADSLISAILYGHSRDEYQITLAQYAAQIGDSRKFTEPFYETFAQPQHTATIRARSEEVAYDEQAPRAKRARH